MARFIPDDVLETIRIRADITEVVQSYVPTLKKMGATWKHVVRSIRKKRLLSP